MAGRYGNPFSCLQPMWLNTSWAGSPVRLDLVSGLWYLWMEASLGNVADFATWMSPVVARRSRSRSSCKTLNRSSKHLDLKLPPLVLTASFHSACDKRLWSSFRSPSVRNSRNHSWVMWKTWLSLSKLLWHLAALGESDHEHYSACTLVFIVVPWPPLSSSDSAASSWFQRLDDMLPPLYTITVKALSPSTVALRCLCGPSWSYDECDIWIVKNKSVFNDRSSGQPDLGLVGEEHS